MEAINEDEALKLIEIVRQFECIYNTKHEDYKAINIKAWHGIAKMANMTPERCKYVWRTLRTQYANRLRRKNRRVNLAGVSQHAFDRALEFLRPHIQVGKDSSKHCDKAKRKSMMQHERLDAEDSLNEHIEHIERLPLEALQDATMQEPWHETDIYFYRISQIVKTLSKYQQARVKMHLYELLHVAELKQLEQQDAANRNADTVASTAAAAAYVSTPD